MSNTLYSQFLYPKRELPKPDPIDGLRSLREYLNKAKDKLAHFNTLNEMALADPRRLYWKQTEINHGILHWTRTHENMVRCWNSTLESLKIK